LFDYFVVGLPSGLVLGQGFQGWRLFLGVHEGDREDQGGRQAENDARLGHWVQAHVFEVFYRDQGQHQVLDVGDRGLLEGGYLHRDDVACVGETVPVYSEATARMKVKMRVSKK
jgi:hypothetical protein